jgi:hypothetical protein
LIKHVWRHMKEWVYTHYSELETLIDNKDIIKKYIIKALQKAWTAINEEFLTKLAESMKRRIETVIQTDNWYTRY